MQKYLVNLIVEFVLRQLSTYTNKIEWSLVEKDLHERIKSLVPECTYEQICVLIDTALEALKAILSNKAQIKMVIELIASEKIPQAYDVLVGLLQDYFNKAKLLTKNERKLQTMLMA